MLKSYEYTEQSYSGMHLQDYLLRDKEIDIAKRFSEKYGHRGTWTENCPVCGRHAGKYFFTKWKVDYLYCKECASIYASCDHGLVKRYQKEEELLDLRRSSVFQEEITKRRMERWKEFLEWMQIRAFRFLGRNKGLAIADIGNRYRDYVKLIRESELCGAYRLVDSILEGMEGLDTGTENMEKGQADLVFYFDRMQQETALKERLSGISEWLGKDGLLVLETRAGSGFDILTLKEHNRKIYPYEHVVLPSVRGLVHLLEENNFRVLEITTPGVMDVHYVMEAKNLLDDSGLFVKFLMEADDSVLQEFQRFLQKNGMSSFVRVIAAKEN